MKRLAQLACGLVSLAALQGCSDDSPSAGAGEEVLTNSVYQVTVPATRDSTQVLDSSMVLRWPVDGGQLEVQLAQENVEPLHYAGELTRTRQTVAGVDAERVESDLRKTTAGQTATSIIRYNISLPQIAKPSATRRTTVDFQLYAGPNVTDAQIDRFRTLADQFLDRLTIS